MEEYFFYLDNLLEDDRKIITLKFFAMKFNIHVNKAIYILDEYVKNKIKTNQNLSIIYCICGDIISEKNEEFFQVELVSEENLKKTLSNYLPGYTHHIYSIQPCPLHSTTILYNVDIDNNKKPSKSGAINLPEVELRKYPICKVPTETLQKLTILNDKKNQNKSDKIKQDNKDTELINEESSKSSEDPSKIKSNTKIPNKNGNNMFSFFGKKLDEKSNLEVNQPIQGKKLEVISSSQCKPSTSKIKTNENKNKLFTQVKNPDKLAKDVLPLILERKRKCNISSSEDEDSLSAPEDLNENMMDINVDTSVLLFDSPSKKKPDEENIKIKIFDSDKNAQKYHDENDNLNTNEKEDLVGSNLNGIARKRTLVRNTFIDNDGFMVTEKVWESAIIKIDSDKLNENSTILTTNDIPQEIDTNADIKVNNINDKGVEKKIKGNKICTKPRQNSLPNKQSMLTNFFKKN